MKRSLAIALALALAAASGVLAEGTPIPGLHRFVLDNGLELFVLENHAVPLARIQITFRCGSIAQSADTAGLFHLYEHMLFKGNAKYPTETEFAAAMTDLGVAEWNGGTATEYVTYYFTVPSDKTEAGLEFWSHAVREPLLAQDELKIEQDVVSNEINGYLSDPDRVYAAAMDKALFESYPWRRDVGGSEAIIKAATVESLKAIQNRYYIPNNAALFVGGDVDPELVRKAVGKIYGDWKKGPAPWASPPPPHPAPKGKPKLLAYPDDSLPEGIAYIELRFRGPDVVSEPKPTFAADVWGYLLQSPSGRFKTKVFEKVPALYEKDYIGAYYYTQRDGGQISFYTYCFVDPALPLADRAAKAFRDATVAGESASMGSEPAYFSDDEFQIVKRKLEDERILSLETPEKFIETLSFWWAVASTDYFFNYVPEMRKVERKDIASFLSRYVLTAAPVIALRVNPTDFKAEAESLSKAGFVTVDADAAFWWRGKK